MSSKKELLAEIAAMEQKLAYEQMQVTHHKLSLIQFWRDNKAAIYALLAPAFVIGWQLSKKGRLINLLKQLSKVVFVTTITNVKRKLIVDISNKLSTDSLRK